MFIIGFEQRIDRLRAYETYCFRIAHFLLDNKSAAVSAVRRAMLTLFQDRAFLFGKENERFDRVRAIVIRTSLEHKHGEA
ncbi:hypothetical protein [Paenibacillus sp. MBLB4367]|uniref:hypothetical protein n=1 Tax=Paenibacillus sp. MBLB4367 TaxID=3384767 RepID=UPI003907E9A3